MRQLKDVAKYVRSKGAGPFWATVDVFLDDDASFDLVRTSPSFTADALAKVLGVAADGVAIYPDATLRVIKISFPRRHVQGAVDDADSHAGQYFVPLLSVPVGNSLPG